MIYAFLPHLFYLIFDPRNFEQLKDQKRELEVSLKTNFEFFRRWKFGSNLVSPKKIHFHYIKNKIEREDKMTSSKSEKKILEIEFGTKIYLLSFICNLFY